MSLQKITFTNSTVSAQKDADFYYFLMSDIGALRGIKNGLQVTNNANRIVLTSGYVSIYGRLLFIEDDTSIIIPLNGVGYGYVIIRINTNNNTAELTYKEGSVDYPNLTQENLMQGLGVYEFPLAKYSKTSINLVLQSFSLKYIDRKEPSFLGTENKDKILIVGNNGYIALQDKNDIKVGKAISDENGTNIADKFSSLESNIRGEIQDRKNADNTINTALNTKVDKETNKGLIGYDSLVNANLNDYTKGGFFYATTGCTNLPIANSSYWKVIVVNNYRSNDAVQIAVGILDKQQFMRTYNDNGTTWSSWIRTDVQPSLYNLGAYDTIKFNDDGTATITRQTGYAKGLKELEQQLNATFQLDGVGSNWSVRLSISTSIINTNFGIKSIYKLDNDAYGYTGPDEIVTFIDTGNNKFSVYGKGNYDTRDKLFSVVFNFQYKLATSYTEKVILNQPLLNLPQEGTQWLREEWEKGLNLFSASVTYDLTAGSEQWKLFQLENLVVGQTYTIYSYDTNDIYYQLMIAYNDFKTKPVTFTATSTRLEARVGKNNLTSNVSGTVKVILVKGKALPQTFYEYYGPLIRQSTLRNQVPMLGADGKNKVMLGCRGSGHNPNGSGVKYIYLGRWENTEINDNDSGIHIKGIIGGWLSPIQAIIDVVASWREGWTFSGSINQKVPYMDIVITDAYKVYLMISDTDTYYNYNIDIECGTNGVVTYTGELLTSVDGNIMARMNEKVYVTLTDEFTSFGRSIDTLKLYSNTNPEWWKNGVKQGQLALTSDINAEIGNKLAKLKDNYLNDNGQVNALGVIDNAMSELTPFYLEAYTNQADFNNDIYQAIKGSVKPKLTSISFDANVASSIFEVIDFDYDAGDTAFYFGIGSIGSKVKDIVTFPVGNPSSIASVDIETSGDTGYISYMVRSIDVTGAISLDAVAVKNVYGLKYYSTPSNATEKTMYINIKITDIYGNVFRTGQITVRFKSNQ